MRIGQLAAVKLVAPRVSVNKIKNIRYSPLEVAVRGGHFDIARQLAYLGVSVNFAEG